MSQKDRLLSDVGLSEGDLKVLLSGGARTRSNSATHEMRLPLVALSLRQLEGREAFTDDVKRALESAFMWVTGFT